MKKKLLFSSGRILLSTHLKHLLLLLMFVAFSQTGLAQTYNMSNAAVSTCSGTFYDSGGIGTTLTARYANNESFTKTFTPATAGNKLKVVFTLFDTEEGFDGLMIYNGNSTAAPLLSSGAAVGGNATTCPAGAFSGTTLPGTFTSTAADGSLTFVFKSDTSGRAGGWAATISCEAPVTTAPNCAGGYSPATGATAIAMNPTLSWTAATGGPTSYDVYFGTSATPPFVVNQTGLSYTPPAPLLANTTYYWKVVAKNSFGSATGCSTQSMTTGSSLTYCATSYSSGTGSGDFIGLVQIPGTTLSNATVGAASPYYTLYPQAGTTTASLQKTIPYTLQVKGGTYSTCYISAWVDYNGDGVFSTTEFVGVSPNCGSSTLVNLTTSLIIPNTAVLGTVRMRLRSSDTSPGASSAQSCGAANSGYGETEDYLLTVTAAPSCFAPSAVTASSVTPNSATISWTAGSPAPSGGYTYEIRTSGAAGSGASGLVTSGSTAAGVTTVAIAALNPNSEYSIYVRSFCGGSDYSIWTAEVVFDTPCNPTTVLPSTENFEGSASCWTVAPITGNNWGLYTSIGTEVPSAHNGSAFAGIAWASGVSTDALLISPPYNISANGNAQTRVKVWVYRATTGVAADRITILVNSSPGITGASTVLNLPRLITQAPTVGAAGWYEYTANIPLSFNGSTFYVMARGVEGGTSSNYSLGLDDFTLEFTPPTVGSFTPSNICASGNDAARTITITGTNFIGTTAVKVNGTDVQSFVVNSSTQITAVVSAAATSGTVAVTGLGGSATSAGSLAIYQNYDFYADNDNDGFGAGAPVSLCSINGTTAPAGYRTNNSDCNDNQLQYLDADGDGFGSTTLVACGVTNNSDCNDNQLQYADNDADGFGSTILVACGVTNNSDCNDNQLQYLDADGDGFGSTTLVACGVTNNSDCNDNQLQYADNDADGFGSTILVACGVTNNSDCNDNQLQYLDADSDGFGSTTLVACGVVNNIDCNDNQLQYADNDADGFGSTILVACGVTNNSDCNDNQLQYLDADGDGFGSTTLVACGVVNNTDCNDNNNAINAAFSFYADADGDSYGAGDLISGICAVDGSTPPAGYSLNDMDCNDSNAAIYQTVLLYIDSDNDGYTTGATESVCYGASIPSGYAAANIGIDCNDNVAAINPGHAEVLYNGVDDNCDGQLDEGFQIT
ncbi:MAG: hypothetical protein EOO06_17425, partial [Chitinophagaceae bacterium]